MVWTGLALVLIFLLLAALLLAAQKFLLARTMWKKAKEMKPEQEQERIWRASIISLVILGIFYGILGCALLFLSDFISRPSLDKCINWWKMIFF